MSDSPRSTAAEYAVRRATRADMATIVRQRCAIFEEAGRTQYLELVERNFAAWLAERLDATYFHWLAEGEGRPVGGAGLLLLDWPPSPRDPRGGIGYVYNVYVEPAHRRRGVARAVLEALHAWARERELGAVALHATDAGRPLYEALGYTPTSEMRLMLAARGDR
ncbi:MAG TPA: GNAT family N-acetyltransferase [Gemmatimonadaceae bacterium]|nr:GNAT family N-acetyltransferase [Gemmatimonadaceae bacterium]